jgi:hypothetical protein
MSAKIDPDELFRDAARRGRRGELSQAASLFTRAAAAKRTLAAKVMARLADIVRRLDRRLETQLGKVERKKTLALRRRLKGWIARTRAGTAQGRVTSRRAPRAGRKAYSKARSATRAKARARGGRAPARRITRKKKAAPTRKGVVKSRKPAAKAPAEKSVRGTFRPLAGAKFAARKPAAAGPPEPDTIFPPEPMSAPDREPEEAAWPRSDVRSELEADFGASRSDEGVPLGTPISGESPEAPVLIRRTPHMDLDWRPLREVNSREPLKPGAERIQFGVLVYLDTEAARSGEDTIDVVVPDRTHVAVLLLASEHFSIESNPRYSLFITADEKRVGPVRFDLSVKPAAELPVASPPSIVALFFHEGRPVGKVSRSPLIKGVAAAPAPTASARLEIEAADAADLVVTIAAAAANDGRQFFCTVRTPLLDGFGKEVAEPWNLPNVTETLVHAYMDRFTAKNVSPGQLIAELKGAGIQLFQAAPKIFQKVFWQLMDSGKSFRDIAIVSEEPFIPWELMVPSRVKDGRQERWDEPLGVRFRIGRWIAGDIVSPRQNIPLVDSYVIAPQYPGNLALQLSPEEVKLVLAAFSGEAIQPASFAQIEQKLKSQGRTLLHFICHGKDNAGGLQTIYLDDKEELSSATIMGMQGLGKAFAEKRPLVFLNACEVGRTTVALMGLGGFAKSFVDLGASAVIAPLWSVKDTIAHEVAKEFYQRAKNEPDKPFAEILRDLRAKAYQPGAEDTYAAYCFYGDPRASASRP